MEWKTMQPCVVKRRNQKGIAQNWGLCFYSYFCGRQCSKLQTGPLFLKFFKLVLSGIGKMMQVEVLINFAKIIPETLYVIPKNLVLQNDSFIKYAVFLKCKTLYNFDDVFVKGQMVRLYQQNAVMWVIHATHTKPERRPCGSLLMKTMRSRAGKTFLYPKQVYCFKNVTDSLEDLINKTNFMENCEKWRNSSTQLPDNVLGDCFEGRVWKELQYVDGEPFLAISNNFGLMLNVDWF